MTTNLSIPPTYLPSLNNRLKRFFIPQKKSNVLLETLMPLSQKELCTWDKI